MKPIKLSVHAFGPYAREQAFDFADLRGRSFFLIHGPTGAGKTSVLDAMCFALYGQASGPQRQPRQLRSDHADPKTLTEVVFDFAVGPDVYRVRRSPEQERPRRKGDGFVTQQPAATLWSRAAIHPTNGDGDGAAGAAEAEGAVVADGWQKVNDAVERLMGFQADQFRQVVMLPQGQFQRLLTAKSDERQSILENLFDVGTFGRIEQSLKDAAGAVRKQIEEARYAHAEILRGLEAASLDDVTTRRDEALAALAQVHRQGGGLRQAKAEAAEKLAAARQVAEKLRELDEARRSLRALEERREEFARKEAAHSRACKAAALAEAEAALQQWRLEAAGANRRLAEARAALDRATAAVTRARDDWSAQVAAEDAREQARRDVDRLAALEEKVLSLAQARAKLRTATEQVGRRTTEREAAGASLEKARRAVEGTEQEAKRLEGIACLLESRQALNREAEKALKDRTRLEAARAEHRAAQDAWHRAQLKVARYQEQLATAKAAWHEKEEAARRGQAAALARALAEGAPCPVCGSTHHPSPAAGGGEVPSDTDVAQLRQSVEQMEFQLHDVREAAADASGRVGEAAATVRAYEESLGPRAAADPDELRHALKRAKEDLDRAEAAGLELSGVARQIEKLRPQVALAESRLAEADAARQRADAEAEAAGAVVAEREAGVPEPLRQGADLAHALGAARRRLKGLIDGFEAARLAAQEAEVGDAKAQAALSAAEESAANAGRQAEAAQASFSRRLADAGFEDLPAYQSAKLSDRQIEALERESRQYRIDLQSARARHDRASAAAEGLAAPDLAALVSAAQSADAALEANVRQEEALSQRLRQLDDALARLKELGASLQSLDARYQIVGRIAEVAGGKNDYRMTFQRYVLGVFLDQVLEAATQRLKVMSRGRYLLQRVRDAAASRGAGGLDLEVFDQHTSTTRPVSTLSGGESFLASLALALGLSDVVQAYAGGIRLETIFIDEGFGSLDPEALDLAIRALRDLQQGGRLVGIISHVTELKEWIDARLEVLPGRRGSTARFVVP